MPIFCNYSDVELAVQPDMQIVRESYEKEQFKLKMVKLADENPRKWYHSSVSFLFFSYTRKNQNLYTIELIQQFGKNNCDW